MKTQILTALIAILASTNCLARTIESYVFPIQLKTPALDCMYYRLSPEHEVVFKARSTADYDGAFATADFTIGGEFFARGQIGGDNLSISILAESMQTQVTPGKNVVFVEPKARMDMVACKYNYTPDQWAQSFPKTFVNASVDNSKKSVLYGMAKVPYRAAWVQEFFGNEQDITTSVHAPEGKIIVGVEFKVGNALPSSDKGLWEKAPFQPNDLGQSSLDLHYQGVRPTEMFVYYADKE